MDTRAERGDDISAMSPGFDDGGFTFDFLGLETLSRFISMGC